MMKRKINSSEEISIDRALHQDHLTQILSLLDPQTKILDHLLIVIKSQEEIENHKRLKGCQSFSLQIKIKSHLKRHHNTKERD